MSPNKVLPVLIGWREKVSLPDLGIKKITVKIDTGARTSALHAFDIHYGKTDGGQILVHFQVHPLRGNAEVSLRCSALLVDKRKVKSSNGKVSLRPVIRTQMVLGTVIKDIEVTLINRAKMDYRMLLGRAALTHDFFIDPSKSFIKSKIPKKVNQSERAKEHGSQERIKLKKADL